MGQNWRGEECALTTVTNCVVWCLCRHEADVFTRHGRCSVGRLFPLLGRTWYLSTRRRRKVFCADDLDSYV